MRSFLFLALLLLSTPIFGQTVRFEPLYGVEHTQNRYPEPARYSTRTFFGLRVLAGVPLLSAELEGTQSNSRRDYPGDNQKVEDEVQRAMLGLRSTFAIASYLAFYLRAGARATQEKTTITDTLTDEKEVKEPPLYFDPYAGTGLQISLANNLALSAGATWVFTGSGRPDVQYTFGFTVKFGQVR